jgi:hypothetical protein
MDGSGVLGYMIGTLFDLFQLRLFSLYTTVVYALHLFAVPEARSPCCVVASHGYHSLLQRLIALHGFAGIG